MSTMRLILLLFLFMLPGTLNAHAQSTMVVLPTNDDTSAFEVQKQDGSTVLKAKGDGDVTVSGTITAAGAVDAQTLSASDNATIGGSVTASSFYGDGSTLSNVRPIAVYSGGDQNFQLTTADQVVRYVEITVPSAGIVIVNAAGLAEFKSVEDEMYRVSITTGTSIDYSYMMAASQLADPDVSDQADSFAVTRGYTVYSAGTYRYNLVGDIWEGDVALRDVNMTAMFFPTAGAGAPKIVSVEEPPAALVTGGSGPFDQP